MSDIRIYDYNGASSLVPLTGDVILCTEAFNGAQANSVHLCTNATGPVWKSFENDGAAEAVIFNENSLSFDGTQYLEAGSLPFINSAGSFSVSAWVNMDASGTGGGVLACGTADQNRMFINLNTTFVSFANKTGRGGVATWNTTLSTGTWYHVVGVKDGTTSYLYVNGTQRATASVDANLGVTAGTNFQIGMYPSGMTAAAFPGLIDEVAFFDTALTEAQIASLRDTSGANPTPADLSSFINNGLNAWWRMGDDSNDTFVDGGSVASITDSSGNGYTATQATASVQPTFSTSVPA